MSTITAEHTDVAPVELTFSGYPFAPLTSREVVKRLRWSAFEHGLDYYDLDGAEKEQVGHIAGELERRLDLDVRGAV